MEHNPVVVLCILHETDLISRAIDLQHRLHCHIPPHKLDCRNCDYSVLAGVFGYDFEELED